MQPFRLAKQSFATSCLLHLVAITSLAAWSASTPSVRPKFAGESQAIELVVTRAEPDPSPPPITFDYTANDEMPVTVEPTTARIARKHFDQQIAAESSFEPIPSEPVSEFRGIEFELHQRALSQSPRSAMDASPPPEVTLPRRHPDPREVQATVIQPPQSVGTHRLAPSFTNSPPPTYPSIAIQNNWEGTVLLRVHINADGIVDEVEVARGSGQPVLDGAAVNAVRRWSGTPATRSGRPIATTELLPVRFKLRD